VHSDEHLVDPGHRLVDLPEFHDVGGASSEIDVMNVMMNSTPNMRASRWSSATPWLPPISRDPGIESTMRRPYNRKHLRKRPCTGRLRASAVSERADDSHTAAS
jgi:hypothetical protein